MTKGRKVLLPKVYSEEYCCLWGYLTLCRERGETYREMAGFIGVPYEQIRKAYRFLSRGKYACAKRGTLCLSPVIEDIQRGADGGLDDPERGD
jgi:hypothetical protein